MDLLCEHSQRLMGNQFKLGVYAASEKQGQSALAEAVEEIMRIERLLSTYLPDSWTNRINAAAGKHPVQVPAEVFQLILRAQALSRISQGAFDLSYGSLDKSFWNFDQAMDRLPDPVLAKKSVHLIDYRNILLDPAEQSVFLKNSGMRIGFGGIGKGYAADRAKALLQSMGLGSGVVNASGDLCVWGQKPDGSAWKVGISHPDRPKEALAHLNLERGAVATSGNYEKFVWIGGKKYSHTIHPKTGYPIQGILSVTVLAPAAELADALTTPIAVMGVGAGLDFAEQLPEVACLMVDEHHRVYATKNLLAASNLTLNIPADVKQA